MSSYLPSLNTVTAIVTPTAFTAVTATSAYAAVMTASKVATVAYACLSLTAGAVALCSVIAGIAAEEEDGVMDYFNALGQCSAGLFSSAADKILSLLGIPRS